MAIIKCPECGHQISDKAPTCPSCGVEIAGKIIKCPKCGEVYFKDDGMCPNCHYVIPQSSIKPDSTALSNSVKEHNSELKPVVGNTVTKLQEENLQQENKEDASKLSINKKATISASKSQSKPQTDIVPPVPPHRDNNNNDNQPKKKNYTPLVVSIVIAILICGALAYWYKDQNANKEQEDYAYAMQHAQDSLVLNDYLDKYKDGPVEHRDSVMAKLLLLRKGDTEWLNTLISNSRTAFENYLSAHPDTPHKTEILHRIDSIDWQVTKTDNTMDAYQTYLSTHSNGEHVDEANENIRALKTKTVLPEEKQQVQAVVREFFMNINARNETGLMSTLNSQIASFIGKTDAAPSDAVTFMNKLYEKEGVESLIWSTSNYKISKKEVGDEKYEYSVSLNARQDVKHKDGSNTSLPYKVTMTISPDMKISSFGLVKILSD